MSNQRQHPRTPMRAQIKIWHASFGELLAHTKDLSDGGVFVEHPDMAALEVGEEVTGQVQGMPFEAPVLRMIVQRIIAGEGAGMQFLDED
ncbi:MAG: PilZ domain-containing protein [Halopseudomonas sabulinigri]